MKNNIKLINLLKGVLLSIVLSLIFILLTSVLLRFTNFQETKISLINNISMTISICVSSMFVAMKTREKGWLYGSLLGGIYFLIVIILNVGFLKVNVFQRIYLVKLIGSIILGAIGGIIGINLI